MKIAILILAIFIILLCFRVLSARKSKSNFKRHEETTIDLEKDPKTKEYKPKE